MIKLTASLAVFYGVSSAPHREASAKILQARLTKHVKGRTAIRYETARKSNIPGWVGESVGVACIGDRLPSMRDAFGDAV